jgi:V8-like Glu-specific endopeptidase/molybdenum-dependent DNA-binding transcriptional regulator ModE
MRFDKANGRYGFILAGLLVGACGGGDKALLPPAPPAAPPPDPGQTAAAVDKSDPRSSTAPSLKRPLTSDEGMWLLSDFPSDRLGKLHGFSPSQEWLDHVRTSAARVGAGCSGSFVSPNGLVMTNHHCAAHCIEQLSTAKKDYIASGFYAKSEKDEVKCPEIEIAQLISITDVTDRVLAATKGLTGARFNEANKGEQSKIEKECAKSDDVRCDVVTLYRGGRYNLYKYQRHQDVRLTFAPEFATAFFGGDPDNFNFPRYDLDVTFLRVYKDNKPLSGGHYFKWSPSGAKEGDLTFVAGHPHKTSREITVAEFEFLRDVELPAKLLRLSEWRGLLTEFQTKGAEQKRIASGRLFYIENSVKGTKGRVEALRDPDVFGKKMAAEKELRAKVDADPAMKEAYGGAWEAIAEAEKKMKNLQSRYVMIESGAGLWSDLVEHARRLVRAGTELAKPNEQRLREFVDSQKPALTQKVTSTAPIYDELETLTLTAGLTGLRAELGPDDPFVRKVLGKETPRELATRLVKGSKLRDPKVRKALFDGGEAAINASKDAMIEFARSIEPEARAVRKSYEDDVEAVVKKNAELIAKARFQVYGTSVYPDATGTLRLSFGQVRGWEEAGRKVTPVTTLGGAFDRATGKDPFALPKSWIDNKAKLDLSTPFNFSTTNDIIGGNSGSPVVDQEGRIVGLVFDGNIHSLGGDYAYDGKDNRAVSVHSAALLEALDKIYGAGRIVEEIKASR